ncbi:MAG TPA: hypothetical protein VIF57_22525 [Polyangia bacterium]
MIGFATAARTGAAEDACRARLKQMDATLTARRGLVRGWTLFVPEIDGFEMPQFSAVQPLEFKGVVVQVSESGLWLDHEPIPGPDRKSQLKELAARIAKIWGNYQLLYPNGPPPIRRMYVLFDKWVMVKDAIRVIDVIGRDDVLVPTALSENWSAVDPAGPVLNARLRSLRGEIDAVSAATKWFDQWKLLEHAMGTCKGRVVAPGAGPGDKRSEDEVRAAWHSHISGLLTACDCRGANVDAVENVLLDEAGGFARPLQRLPLQLKATGGKAVDAGPDERVVVVLADYLSHTAAGTRPITIRERAPRATKR